jgi:hypothetical protein
MKGETCTENKRGQAWGLSESCRGAEHGQTCTKERCWCGFKGCSDAAAFESGV